MKKVFLSLLLTGAVAGFINAQESIGGIPWSVSNKVALESSKVSVLSLPTPDYVKAQKEDEYNETIGKPGKYRVALAVNSDINLAKGSFTYLSDGRRIWRLHVEIPNSQALKLQYGDFYLPAGVTYYVQNENRKQLIGGYSYSSNTYTKSMAHEMIQGSAVNLEMDIEAGVDLSAVQFEINQVYGLYRGAERINHDYGNATTEATYDIDAADSCQINAKCAPAAPWFNYANAVAHIWITDGNSGGFCSGTLINNTAKDCAPLFLTASHCDGNNSYSSSNFSQWEFSFNIWTPLCGGGGNINYTKVAKGADFLARSYMTIPGGSESGPLYGDFLLLKLKSSNSVLSSWGLALAGWNSAPTSTDTAWVSFHHPKGDAMKFTKMRPLNTNGSFNTAEVGTHWAAKQVIGGSEPGSSGSGIWEASTGRLIGDLSGGSGSACTVGRSNLYSKISYTWNNEHDTAYYSNGIVNANNSKLSKFLDPGNTNATSTEFKWLSNPCDVVSIQEVKELENAISLYPNPNSGFVYMKVNLAKVSELKVDVINIVGQHVGSYTLKNVGLNEEFKFDFSSFQSGVYMMSISSENVRITKKFVINK
ncbi:T9SS type A sorting domain-containing protein [Taibaiella lutea]|uniref:T9SS type A sorting domain-containing protein n=1 Tax=Taibaiella lutea TaxID=2608001 RepID=A0A5M6CJD8_9BACT|nr:T9SS type A sorting domain-containing protein [Taibaiella lutea]KAA5533475.1 T9SS type A sorting domain-containing protein [Taibaiella lutea]